MLISKTKHAFKLKPFSLYHFCLYLYKHCQNVCIFLRKLVLELNFELKYEHIVSILCTYVKFIFYETPVTHIYISICYYLLHFSLNL